MGPVDPELTLAAFSREEGWALAAVSSADQPRPVHVRFPDSPAVPMPIRFLRLDFPGPEATNETTEEVRLSDNPLKCEGGDCSFTLPAWGLAALLPAATTP